MANYPPTKRSSNLSGFLLFYWGVRRIFDLWMACHTQQEIADEVGVTHSTVINVLSKMEELPKLTKPTADHLVDFKVPIYNVWKFQKLPAASGRIVTRWFNARKHFYIAYTRVPIKSPRVTHNPWIPQSRQIKGESHLISVRFPGNAPA